MYAVVPFQLTDEGGAWGSPRAAIVEADTPEAAIDKFVLACVHPHADNSVWGEAADQGSSPEHAGDHHYYIVYGDDEDDHITIDLSIMVARVKLFEDDEEAEDYRDSELRTYSWAFDDRGDE